MDAPLKTTHRLHPAMSILPDPTKEEWECILATLRKYGRQRGEIEVVGNLIVRGRDTWKACVELGIAPSFTTVDPPEEIVEYIVRRNVPPTSLSFLDRCCIAVLGKEQFTAITKKKMRDAGSVGGKRKGKGRVESARPFEGERWFEHAAKIVGVHNARAISTLAGIREKAPDVFAAVRARKILQLNEAKMLAKASNRADRQEVLSRSENTGVPIIVAIHDLARKKHIATLPDAVFEGKRYRILTGDMEEQAASLQDNFAHMVYADIVYGPPECFEMAAKAARIAARILVPEGVFAFIGGHVHFDTLVRIISEESKGELRGACIGFMHYPNASHGLAAHANLAQRVTADYVMYFMKGAQLRRPISSLTYETDRVVAKPHHPWEKNLKGTQKLVLAAAGEGAVVVDVCCGSATTGEATMRLDGHFIGIEKNPETANIAAKRLTGVEMELTAVAQERAAADLAVIVERDAKKPFKGIERDFDARPVEEKPPIYCIVRDGLLVVRHRKQPVGPIQIPA